MTALLVGLVAFAEGMCIGVLLHLRWEARR